MEDTGNTDSQEKYLTETSLWGVILRGIKKLATEFSSIKFLLLIFVCAGIWTKIISEGIGLGAALVLVGMREIPVDQIMAKISGKI